MSAEVIEMGGRRVGRGEPPWLIAELSGNHNGSLERALAIVDAAAVAGAHAVKIQTYTADTMTLDLSCGEFFVSDPKNPWAGRTLHQLYQEAHTPWDWHPAILERCRARGLTAFSTPFDATAVDFLESLDVPCYKIASHENVDLPLIRRVAATGKPMIISTGLATVAQLDEAVAAARSAGCGELMLLKCTSTYPADPGNSNLATIPHMSQLFGCPVGLSDHTPGIGVAVASIALGGAAIEKHITLARSDGGVDAAFSLEPAEFRTLATECERAWRAFGKVFYGPTDDELTSLRYRRSLYIVADVKAGEVLDARNLRAIRPGLGLPPELIGRVLGRVVTRDVAMGTPLSWDLIGAPS